MGLVGRNLEAAGRNLEALGLVGRNLEAVGHNLEAEGLNLEAGNETKRLWEWDETERFPRPNHLTSSNLK